MLQFDSRTRWAVSEQPTPVTLIGFPTVFRCSWRASATSTSVVSEPVSMMNGNNRPWMRTRATASTSPRPLKIFSGTVAAAVCPPLVDASPPPVKPMTRNEPTRHVDDDQATQDFPLRVDEIPTVEHRANPLSARRPPASNAWSTASNSVRPGSYTTTTRSSQLGSRSRCRRILPIRNTTPAAPKTPRRSSSDGVRPPNTGFAARLSWRRCTAQVLA